MTKPLGAPRRSESSLDLAFGPISAGETLQAWVYGQLRERILGGALPAGARVPSTRSLAQRLKVSRSTVEVAYDQLRAEGYLSGTVGSGTYVSVVIPDRLMRAAPAINSGVSRVGARIDRPTDDARRTSSDAERLNAPFIARVADPMLFPMDAWRRHLHAATRSVTPHQQVDGDPQGQIELRAQIAQYLGLARGIVCAPEQIVVVSGIRHGLDLAARLLLTTGDKVLLEDPGYVHAIDIFQQYSRRVLPVPIDGDGFSVAKARRHRDVKLVHVTPAHQSPTGLTMSVSRRLDLLSWAREAGVWVIEDDYDSEFNYRTAPLPALKNLDVDDRVIHCGSFNKTMFAALRIGYIVVPRALVAAFAKACHVTGRSIGAIDQIALTEFLKSGAFARHLRRARATYARRRERALAVLADCLGNTAPHVSGEHGGFHFAWWFPPSLDEQRFFVEARRRGLRFQSITDFCRRTDMPSGVLVGDSALQDKKLELCLVALRETLAACDVARTGRPARPATARPTARSCLWSSSR